MSIKIFLSLIACMYSLHTCCYGQESERDDTANIADLERILMQDDTVKERRPATLLLQRLSPQG